MRDYFKYDRECTYLLGKIPVYNENITGKSILDELWETLAVELNEMGPPIRTAMQWRRVWSVFKYNTKRTLARGGTSSQSRLKTRRSGNRRAASKGRTNARTSARETFSSQTGSSGSCPIQGKLTHTLSVFRNCLFFRKHF